MSSDAEGVVRRLKWLNGHYETALLHHDRKRSDEVADEIAAMADVVIEEIERQSAEIATLRAQVAALEEALKPFAEAAYSLDPKSPGGSSILDTYCAGLLCASDLRRARDVFNIDECSPTPAPAASPQSSPPASGTTPPGSASAQQ